MPGFYAVVSKPDGSAGERYYLFETRSGSVAWSVRASMAKQFYTFGAAKRFAEEKLPHDREYHIVFISTSKGVV